MTQLLVTQTLQDAARLGHVTTLKNARIGYSTITRGASIVASSEAAGHPASNLSNWLTYERWGADSTPQSASVADARSPVDYCGIASHTISDISGSVAVQYSTDAGQNWNTVAQATPADNSPILILFSERRADAWRILVTGDGGAFEIGILYIGKALAMQRGAYSGVSPFSLSRKTKIRPMTSESGHFIGRSVIRRGHAAGIKWDNLTNAWYRNNFDPFVESAIEYPFFFAWRPYIDAQEPALILDFVADEYSVGGDFVSETDDFGFVWTDGDITPDNTGPRDLMSVSISMSGLSVSG